VSEAAAAVRWLLNQAESEARRVAVHQIGKVPGSESTELLRLALGDDDWRVRKEAALAAAELDRRDEVVGMLVSALEEAENIGLRNAAVEALVAIGPAAIAPTIEALPRFDLHARKLAVEVLGGVPDPRGTRALAHALHDDDDNVRVTAAEALGNAALSGEESRDIAVGALAATLTGEGGTLLELAALGSLARLEATLPWALIEPAAKNPLLRRHALAIAARLREPRAVRALAASTGDPSPAVAETAILALGDLVASSIDQPELLTVAREELLAGGCRESLRRAARSEDAALRGSAVLALGLLGDPADVALLADALGDDDVAQQADLALHLSGPACLEPLLAAVRYAAPAVRAAALSLAATLDGADAAILRASLRAGLSDGAPEVVACSVAELGRTGEAEDLPRVASLVAAEDEHVSAAAAVSAATIAARHPEAARRTLRDIPPTSVLACILLAGVASAEPLRDAEVRLLERALTVDDAHVRRAAIDALAQSGGEVAADAVVFALADEVRDVQLAALRALGRMGRAEPLAGVVADTRDPVLTASALRALAEADPERALGAARKLVGHLEPAVAASGVEALGALRSASHLAERCEDALFEALDHPDPEVVKLALTLLGGRPTFRAVARIGLSLDHPAWEIRRLAAEILSQDPSPAAQEFLRARYERENDSTVRDAISAAVSIRPPGRDSSRPRRPRNSEGL
jgi:HEAT repeat protein